MRKYKFEAPQSFEELFQIMHRANFEKDEIKFVAGGTDFVPRLNFELNMIPSEQKQPLQIMYLGCLGMDSIIEKDGIISIGACCKLNDIMKNPVICEKIPVLVETISQMAGLTIRNTGTIGGNIMNASPANDSIPTFIVLDANFILNSEKEERTVKASEFFTGPGKTVAKPDEVLTRIEINLKKGHASFKKLGRRQAETLSVVNAAAYVEQENSVCKTVRVAVGSVGPTVIRCERVEVALRGKKLTEDVIKTASLKVLNEINPIDDLRASAWYRNKTAPVMVSRAIKAAAGIRGE